MLHGLSGCASRWNPLARFLAPQRHVLALDQRGHGDSQWADVDRYTTEDFVSDISGFIQALGIKKLTLMGHSMGGRNALAYTASHPEKVNRLVIEDVGPELSKTGLKRVLEMSSLKRTEYDSLEEVIDFLKLDDPLAQAELLAQEAESFIRKLPSGKLTWKHDRRMEEAMIKGRGIEPIDWWGLIATIICPTLILRGKESDILDSEVAGEMTRKMPQAELVEIEGACHNLLLDNPEKFRQAVFRFLRIG